MQTTEPKTSTQPRSHSREQALFFRKEGEGTAFFSEFGVRCSPVSEAHSDHPAFFKPERNGEAFFQPGGVIQPKLMISSSGDKYEREADTMADRVVGRLSDSAEATSDGSSQQSSDLSILQSSILPALSRKCAECAAEEQTEKPGHRRKPIFESEVGPDLQRKCTACEQEEGLGGVQRRSNGPEKLDQSASSDLEARLAARKGRGAPLPKTTHRSMDAAFGADFSSVRIHTDYEAVQMNKELDAQAFTHGTDIYFNTGKYNVSSRSGNHLLAHELTHVIQQTGRIQRAVSSEEDCPPYERGEISKSKTSSGFLADDVSLHRPGELLIADYGNDWGSPKATVRENPLLQSWLTRFELDPSFRVRIIGYSDCAGPDSLNVGLRHRRARKIEELFGEQALQRLTFRGMAALGQYVTDNSNPENRAKNRSVIIEFQREITFEEPEEITAGPFCGPKSTGWLIRQMNRNKDHPAIRTNRENSWAWYIPFFNLGWSYGFMSDFRDLVKAGGPWDFKSKNYWRYQEGRLCPSESCDRTVTLCGHCLNYDVPGNIHFGWVGRAGAIRPWLLHYGAARAQAGGVDDPRDTAAIDIGIRMWDNGAGLCDEINANIGSLNQDGAENCSLCGIPL